MSGSAVVSGNTAKAGGGGVRVNNYCSFILEGGTIYGASEGDNANKAKENAALDIPPEAFDIKWGASGAYTKGGVAQTAESEIGSSNDTLIAVAPEKKKTAAKDAAKGKEAEKKKSSGGVWGFLEKAAGR
ncbi:MAG: hypothetical protein LBD20_10500 [Spirochaetaceae bacterium]|jgi:predicted outer membrane repeat protein|nr:hypothetical protein [Spirochaetaceae bacterium]